MGTVFQAGGTAAAKAPRRLQAGEGLRKSKEAWCGWGRADDGERSGGFGQGPGGTRDPVDCPRLRA